MKRHPATNDNQERNNKKDMNRLKRNRQQSILCDANIACCENSKSHHVLLTFCMHQVARRYGCAPGRRGDKVASRAANIKRQRANEKGKRGKEIQKKSSAKKTAWTLSLGQQHITYALGASNDVQSAWAPER
jgi:hypothetical protein